MSEQAPQEILYRYVLHYPPLEVPEPFLVTFLVVKTTPKGKWVVHKDGIDLYQKGRIKARWVSNTSNKRLCHPTKEEAMAGLIFRQQYRKEILESTLSKVNSFLDYVSEESKGDL